MGRPACHKVGCLLSTVNVCSILSQTRVDSVENLLVFFRYVWLLLMLVFMSVSVFISFNFLFDWLFSVSVRKFVEYSNTSFFFMVEYYFTGHMLFAVWLRDS